MMSLTVLPLVGVVSALDDSHSYGPFQNLVSLASTAIPAAAALVSTWWGKTRWHPTGEVVEKIVGLAGAIAILLLVIVPWQALVGVVVVGLAVAIGCGLFYAQHLNTFIYVIKHPVAADRYKRETVVRGELTPENQKRLSEGVTFEDLVKEREYDASALWTPESRARNTTTLAVWYLPTVVGGTAALAAAVLLFSKFAVSSP